MSSRVGYGENVAMEPAHTTILTTRGDTGKELRINFGSAWLEAEDTGRVAWLPPCGLGPTLRFLSPFLGPLPFLE